MKILLLMFLPFLSFSQDNNSPLRFPSNTPRVLTSELAMGVDTIPGKVVYLHGFDVRVEKGFEIRKFDYTEIVYAYFLYPNKPLKARDVIYFRAD